MIPRINNGLHWDGVPIDKMNIAELRLVLAYKMYELTVALRIMSDLQRNLLEHAMKGVHVPHIVRGGESA